MKGDVRYYYVDEAGDPTLFSRRGKGDPIGTGDVSTFFILGLLDVEDPRGLAEDFDALRRELMSDATLSSVPSMRPERKKTAVLFHAKDDCAEVRREVFKMLMRHRLKFFALVRDKRHIAKAVREHPGYRYRPNHLYDKCVSRLFKERLHKEDGYIIHFAKRGRKDRTEALRTALMQARNNLERTWGISSSAPIEVKPSIPKDEAGLQAVDYFLWALQRLYEREEDRYWKFILPSVSLVHDVDDTRKDSYGVYYSKNHPLTREVKKEKELGI